METRIDYVKHLDGVESWFVECDGVHYAVAQLLIKNPKPGKEKLAAQMAVPPNTVPTVRRIDPSGKVAFVESAMANTRYQVEHVIRNGMQAYGVEAA